MYHALVILYASVQEFLVLIFSGVKPLLY